MVEFRRQSGSSNAQTVSVSRKPGRKFKPILSSSMGAISLASRTSPQALQGWVLGLSLDTGSSTRGRNSALDIVSLIQSLLDYCWLTLGDCSAFEAPRTMLASERIYHNLLRLENYGSSSSLNIV
jgi:hypothetical protein